MINATKGEITKQQNHSRQCHIVFSSIVINTRNLDRELDFALLSVAAQNDMFGRYMSQCLLWLLAFLTFVLKELIRALCRAVCWIDRTSPHELSDYVEYIEHDGNRSSVIVLLKYRLVRLYLVSSKQSTVSLNLSSGNSMQHVLSAHEVE